MAKSALEVQVQQNTKDIDGIGDTMHEMLKAIQGLRQDMNDRGEKMIKMLTDHNTALTKNMTDHELLDITRFGEVKSKIAYYTGGGAAVYAIIALAVGGLDLYIRH